MFFFIFICKSDSTITNVCLFICQSVCLSIRKTPQQIEIQSLVYSLQSLQRGCQVPVYGYQGVLVSIFQHLCSFYTCLQYLYLLTILQSLVTSLWSLVCSRKFLVTNLQSVFSSLYVLVSSVQSLVSRFYILVYNFWSLVFSTCINSLFSSLQSTVSSLYRGGTKCQLMDFREYQFLVS